MINIKRFLWSFLVVLTGLWWFADQPALANLPKFFSWRTLLIQYRGVLAMGLDATGFHQELFDMR